MLIKVVTNTESLVSHLISLGPKSVLSSRSVPHLVILSNRFRYIGRVESFEQALDMSLGMVATVRSVLRHKHVITFFRAHTLMLSDNADGALLGV